MRRLPWNWRQRIEIVRETSSSRSFVCRRIKVTENHYELQFKKGMTPKGRSRTIGYLNIETYPSCLPYVADVWVDERLQGKGLGRWLYETALTDLGKLRTHYHRASKEAQRVWQGLIKRHRYTTDFWKNELTVYVE